MISNPRQQVKKEGRKNKRTSRARKGIQPDKLTTPPRSCRVESAVIMASAAPCEKPMRMMRRASTPRWICASMRLSMMRMLSAMPGSSYSSAPGGRAAMSNQLGRRMLRWYVTCFSVLVLVVYSVYLVGKRAYACGRIHSTCGRWGTRPSRIMARQVNVVWPNPCIVREYFTSLRVGERERGRR